MLCADLICKITPYNNENELKLMSQIEWSLESRLNFFKKPQKNIYSTIYKISTTKHILWLLLHNDKVACIGPKLLLKTTKAGFKENKQVVWKQWRATKGLKSQHPIEKENTLRQSQFSTSSSLGDLQTLNYAVRS